MQINRRVNRNASWCAGNQGCEDIKKITENKDRVSYVKYNSNRRFDWI